MTSASSVSSPRHLRQGDASNWRNRTLEVSIASELSGVVRRGKGSKYGSERTSGTISISRHCGTLTRRASRRKRSPFVQDVARVRTCLRAASVTSDSVPASTAASTPCPGAILVEY